MSQYDLISVIVPILNESASLRELYERTRRALAGRSPFEFIAIDDGSSDDTLKELKALRADYANVCILSHYRNLGKSLALMQAFAAARGEIAVVMDGDLQDQPEMIPRFLEKIEEGFDLVNGWRNDRQDKLSKRLVSWVFNRMTTFIFKCPTHDINCGFKVLRRCVYQRLELRGDLHRLIPAMAVCKGFKVTEVPVEHSPRRFGTSRYRLLRHRGLLDIVALIASNTTMRPFHVFCEAAAACWLFVLLGVLGWLGLVLYLPADSTVVRVAGPIAAFVCLGTAFLGLVLPLFGFQLEVVACGIQDAEWREGLLKERLGVMVSGDEPCVLSQRVRQVDEQVGLPEPDSRLVAIVEEATAA